MKDKLSRLQSAKDLLKHDANDLNGSIEFLKKESKIYYELADSSRPFGQQAFVLLNQCRDELKEDIAKLRTIEVAIKAIKYEMAVEILGRRYQKDWEDAQKYAQKFILE